VGPILAVADGQVTHKVRVESAGTQLWPQVALSPDGAWLATAEGKRIGLYNVSSAAKKFDFNLKTPCDILLYSPDGTRLAMLSKDEIQLWDPQYGQEQMTMRPPEAVVDMAFGNCGHVLVTAGENGSVRVWDVASGNQRSQLDPGPGSICVALSLGGRRAIIRARTVPSEAGTSRPGRSKRCS